MENILNKIFLTPLTTYFKNIFQKHCISEARVLALMSIYSMVFMLISLVLGPIAFYQNKISLFIIDMILFSALVLQFFVLCKIKKNLKIIKIFNIFIIFSTCTSLLANGGPNNSSSLWVVTAPLLFLFVYGIKIGTLLSFFQLLISFCIVLAGKYTAYLPNYEINFILRLFFLYIALYCFSLFSEKVRIYMETRLDESEKALETFVPICANCKKIKNENNIWEPVETYIKEKAKTQVSHGICPECANKIYSELDLSDDE